MVNDGFSVVAPMRVIVPFSTSASRASCCAFDQRCNSSTNRIVPALRSRAAFAARLSSSRSSATPLLAAESVRKRRRVEPATQLAKLVFPQPGGPHKMSDGSWSAARAPLSTASRASPCPKRSATRLGRMRSASGLDDGVAAGKAADEPPEADGMACEAEERGGSQTGLEGAEVSRRCLFSGGACAGALDCGKSPSKNLFAAVWTSALLPSRLRSSSSVGSSPTMARSSLSLSMITVGAATPEKPSWGGRV
jgi:hypothetical protein